MEMTNLLCSIDLQRSSREEGLILGTHDAFRVDSLSEAPRALQRQRTNPSRLESVVLVILRVARSQESAAAARKG